MFHTDKAIQDTYQRSTSATVRLRQNSCNLPLPISRTLSCLLRGVWERMIKLFPMKLKSLSASFGYDPVSACPTFDIKLGDITRPAMMSNP